MLGTWGERCRGHRSGFQTMFRGTPGGSLLQREGEDRLMKDEECEAHLKIPSISNQSIWLPLLFPLTGKSLWLLKAWELRLK